MIARNWEPKRPVTNSCSVNSHCLKTQSLLGEQLSAEWLLGSQGTLQCSQRGASRKDGLEMTVAPASAFQTKRISKALAPLYRLWVRLNLPSTLPKTCSPRHWRWSESCTFWSSTGSTRDSSSTHWPFRPTTPSGALPA